MKFNFSRFLNFFLIFMLVYLTLQLLFPKAAVLPDEDLVIQLPSSMTVGKVVAPTLINTTEQAMTLPLNCPEQPFFVSRYQNGLWDRVTAETVPARCAGQTATLPAGGTTQVSYEPWQATLFTEAGQYRIEIPVEIGGEERVFQRDITIKNPGFFGTIWREGFYKPMYNALIFFTDLTSGSFGWGIVLLTLAIRVILFYPFHRSMVAQRKLQKLQPEMEKIRTQFKDNQQMQAMEMIALYKKHQVNPMSSCLPILIQMPFLIAIFWIVQGSTGANNIVLLYDGLVGVDVTVIDTSFYGLSLLSPNIYFLPLAVGFLQFVQLRLAMQYSKNMPKPKVDPNNPMAEAMQVVTKYMQYILPVIVAVFTATLPAAVGLYWGASTAFGIAQQLVVNKTVK